MRKQYHSYHATAVPNRLGEDQHLLVGRSLAANGALVSQPDGETKSSRASSERSESEDGVREMHPVGAKNVHRLFCWDCYGNGAGRRSARQLSRERVVQVAGDRAANLMARHVHIPHDAAHANHWWRGSRLPLVSARWAFQLLTLSQCFETLLPDWGGVFCFAVRELYRSLPYLPIGCLQYPLLARMSVLLGSGTLTMPTLI